MVRGLVEQDQIRGSGELRREAEPSAFATAQARKRAMVRAGGIEAESLQHGVDLRVVVVAAGVRETLLLVPIALDVRLRDAITESRELLDRHPQVQRSVRLRNPYVDPMNALQVELLERHRAGDAGALRPLLRSIAGIAAALRNTG